MSIHQTIENLYRLHKEIDSNLETVRVFLIDHTFSLEERWAVYEQLVIEDIITDVINYPPTFIDKILGVDFLYECDFNRGEIIKFNDLLDIACMDYDISEEKKKLLKEAIIWTGRAGFRFDW